MITIAVIATLAACGLPPVTIAGLLLAWVNSWAVGCCCCNSGEV